MDSIKSLSIVNKVLFPAPESSYSSRWTSLPGELLWLPVPFSYLADEDEEEIDEGEKEKGASRKKTKDTLRRFPCHLVRANRSDKLMIYSHGNGCDIGQMSTAIENYSRYFYVNVLAVEYPGYGPCGGSPSESGCNEHMRATYDFATQQLGFKPEDIIIFGRSIGTGIATELVYQLQGEGTTVAALVLQSPYLSVKTLAKSLVGVAAKLIWDRFENVKKMPSIKSALLIIHGDSDQLIPYQHAEKLHELATEAAFKEIVIAEGADHNYFNEERDICKPIKELIKQLYGSDYREKGNSDVLKVPNSCYRVPEHAGEGKPAEGGVWAALFASSAALFESSGAISTGDDTTRVDATTAEKSY